MRNLYNRAKARLHRFDDRFSNTRAGKRLLNYVNRRRDFSAGRSSGSGYRVNFASGGFTTAYKLRDFGKGSTFVFSTSARRMSRPPRFQVISRGRDLYGRYVKVRSVLTGHLQTYRGTALNRTVQHG